MKNRISIKYAFFCGTACCISSILRAQQDASQMNVLFIMADDMRPELGCYGVDVVKTPNMDRLAASGVLFQNAYCNIPVSGASRASLLTGVYPHYPDRFISFSAYASKDCPEAIPISGWFTRNGYHTISDGKVFHHISDHADSWSEPPYRNHPNGYDVYWAEYNKWELWMNSESGKTINPKTMRGPFCESADVPDTAYDDGKLANRAIRDLKRMKEAGKPFFLACGFWKPHLPFNAPKKYWDLYKREEIPLATNRFRPEGLPEQAKIAEELGYDSDHIRILSSGDVLEIDEDSAVVTGKVHVGNVMVDGLGVGDVGNIVLRDRQRLAEDGIIIVVMTLESGSGQVLAGPDIVSRGFVYVRNSESLMDEAKNVLDDTMARLMDNNITDWGKIKNEVKDALGDFVWKETKRRPMIMPIIMEV